MDSDRPKSEEKSPWLAIGVFYVLGISFMLPWNFFITADSYWQFKLRNTSLEDDWDAPGVDLTRYQVSFMPALVIISNTVCLIFFFFNSAIARRISEQQRILGALGITLCCMVIITLFAILNTDYWQGAFFGISLFLVALLNVGIAILQSSVFGLVGLFPGSCITSFMSGQCIAGVLSSVAQIISLAIGDADPIVTGIIYFCIGDAIIIVTIVYYIYFIKTDYYSQKKELSMSINAHKTTTSWREYFTIFKKVFWMGFTFGFVMLITLAVFPAVQVYVVSSGGPNKWTDVFFQPTITFLLFNIFDMVGREFVRLVQWPSHEGWSLHIVGLCRIIFIPLILLCYGDNKTFPTVFYNDAWYIVINILFAFTNGYIITLASLYYPKYVTEAETEIAGTIMVSILGVGMVIGSALSPAFVAVWGPNTS